MASLADQIAKLISPAPSFHDPEDNVDDSGAKVLDKDVAHEVEDESSTPKQSKLRKVNVKLLADEDNRYSGKRISRKSLEGSDATRRKFQGGAASSDEDSVDDDDDDEEEEEENDDDVSRESESEDTRENVNHDDESDEDDELNIFKEKMKLSERKKRNKALVFNKDKGFGEYGDSENSYDEDDDESGDSDDELDNDEEDDQGTSQSSDNEIDEDSDIEDDDADEGEGVRNFSRASVEDDKEKGEAVRNQLGLYDSLLKGRIEIQKILTAANQLPQPDKWNEFIDSAGDEYCQGIKEAQSSLHQLLIQLLELQTLLYQQNPETAFMMGESSDKKTGAEKQPEKDEDEITSESEIEEDDEKGEENKTEENVKARKRKRQLRPNEVPELLAKRHKAFKPYRNQIIQKWYDKTRVASGKLSKGFSAFEQSALKQIDQIMADKDRLVKRTQLKRSGYRILGKSEEEDESDEEQRQRELEGTSKARDTKSYDEEIFDDDDFYHQLLRELIERKTSDINDPIAITRQWLEIQKLRNKVKKKVDTKASKGRKIRYHIHPKLVNFMAPSTSNTWSDEAKNDLFSSLFGQRQTTSAQDT